MAFSAEIGANDIVARIGWAWRELRRGESSAVVRDQLFGIGPDAVEPAQLDVLDLLITRDHWRMSDLAASLRVDPSTMTRTLQRMEAAGLAWRSPGTDDGRVVTVQPTAEGRQRHRVVAARRTEIVTRLLTGFTRAEQVQLVELLERFISAVDEYAARGAPVHHA